MFHINGNNGISLVLLHRTHADEVIKLVNKNRERLRKWLPWVDNTKTVQDVEKFIETSLKNFADNGSCDLMIKKEKDICGVIGINRIDELNKTAVLGYWIDKDYEGMGIIRESCKTLISYCFDFLNLYRVEIHCSVENHRSIAIPYSLGFTHEGTFRKAMLVHEEKQDAKIYGLFNSEWRRADV